MKSRRTLTKIVRGILYLILAAVVFFLASNSLILLSEEKYIVSREEAAEQDADCILILGAGVWDGEPSPMLSDRLDEGIALYEAGAAPKILVSGDHGQADYDEVNAMKGYLMKAGIPGEDIFMDHAGFSTYESMARASAVFQVEKAIVVTQKYHMYRALYVARQLKIEAVGVSADPRAYRGALFRNVREWVARDKDIFTCLFRVKPKYLGDTIDIHGDGNVTNDR